MSDVALTRRCLLAGVSSACLANMLPLQSRVATAADPVCWPMLTLRLERFFTNRQSAGIIGEAYLGTAPDEADPRTLARAISATVSGGCRVLALADEAGFRRLIASEQRRDFEHGRTVVIDGWVLSLTEARLAAITALDRRRPGPATASVG